VNLPLVDCGEISQNLNHIFWTCPLLNEKRDVMYKILRELKLFDPFSLEYLIGNLNRKIANVIINFSKKYIKYWRLVCRYWYFMRS